MKFIYRKILILPLSRRKSKASTEKKSRETSKEKSCDNWVSRLHMNKEEQRVKRDKYDKLHIKGEMSNFTGKPEINTKSKAMDSDIMIAVEGRIKANNAKRIVEILEEIKKKDKVARKPWKMSRGSLDYFTQTGHKDRESRIEIELLNKGKR